jgi:hypothetical protein
VQNTSTYYAVRNDKKISIINKVSMKYPSKSDSPSYDGNAIATGINIALYKTSIIIIKSH